MKVIFITILICLFNHSFGQTSSTEGDWEIDTNWTGGFAPPTDLNNEAVVIEAGLPITRNGDIRYNTNSNGSITINDSFVLIGDLIWSANSSNASLIVNDTMIVTGNIILEMNAGSNIDVSISANAVLIVQQDFQVANGALNGVDVSSNGTLIVGGDFDLGSGSNISNDGNIYAGSTSGSGNVNGSGGGVGTLDDLLDDNPDLCSATDICSATLPVSLMDFSASVFGDNIELKWSTASELNNDFFSIERSFDGTSFTELARISGSGTINEIRNYSLMTSSFTKAIFYRLSQTDFDGSHELLKTIYLQVNPFSHDLVYPNPIHQGESIQLRNISTIKDWSIYSLIGQVVHSGSQDVIRTSHLSKGIYILKVNSIEGIRKQRFVLE